MIKTLFSDYSDSSGDQRTACFRDPSSLQEQLLHLPPRFVPNNLLINLQLKIKQII